MWRLWFENRFGTLTLCAASFCNITSCDVSLCCFTLCSNIPIAIIPVVLYLIVVVEFSTVAVALPPMIAVVELRFVLLALGVAVVSAVVMAFRRRWRFAPGRHWALQRGQAAGFFRRRLQQVVLADLFRRRFWRLRHCCECRRRFSSVAEWQAYSAETEIKPTVRYCQRYNVLVCISFEWMLITTRPK